MSDDDEDLPEIVSHEPVLVPETNLLFRLTPRMTGLALTSRQSAIVAAETEPQARGIAKAGDPFGRDWNDEAAYACDIFEDAERHVVGDVVFKSTPTAPPNNPPSKTPEKKQG